MRQCASAVRVFSVALLLAPAAAGADPGNRRDEVVAVVDRVKAAVVNIHSERLGAAADDAFRGGVTQPQRVNGMGTGIVLDPRGYIVTNYHVVDDVQSLRVRLCDGTNCPARVVALDKESDLAVIKIDPPSPLPTVPLGTAQDLMLAERVIAVGNAFGYEHTVTVGHVSALKRDVTLNKEVSYRSLIQTQTPINPGNSGGPLFNRLGEVVGVNVAIRAGAQNIAFAIPVDTMISKAADMLGGRKRGSVRHGLVVDDLYTRSSEDAPIKRWVRVTRVEADSPAAEAGVKIGDILDRVADVTVATSIDLERALLDRPVNVPVAMKVRRGTEAADLAMSLHSAHGVAATLVSNPAPLAGDTAVRKLGVKLLPVGAESVARANRDLRGGLLVQDVAGGSVGARCGILKGDILIGLHQWEALSADNVSFVLNHKDLPTFGPLKAFVVRDGKVREVVLTGVE